MTPLAVLGRSPDLSKFPEDHYVHAVTRYFERTIREGRYQSYVMVSGIPIHFDPSYKNISVNLSAGADSTILMYILCKIIETLGCDTKIKPTSIVRHFKNAPFTETAKERIYAALKDEFPNVVSDHLWGFLPPAMEFTPIENMVLNNEEKYRFHKEGVRADVLYFVQFNEWITRKYGLDALYNGTTTNPTTEVIPKTPKFRDAVDIENHHGFNLEMNNISPFAYVEKSWVTAQYEVFNRWDLFNMTQSCEESDGGCNKTDICFHCAEREWSVKESNRYV